MKTSRKNAHLCNSHLISCPPCYLLRNESAYVSVAVMSLIYCHSRMYFYVCFCVPVCMFCLKMRARLPRVHPNAKGLIAVCFLISAQQLFQKLKNLMRPYSVEFESPLELSAQGGSKQHTNAPKLDRTGTCMQICSSVVLCTLACSLSSLFGWGFDSVSYFGVTSHSSLCTTPFHFLETSPPKLSVGHTVVLYSQQ